MSDESKIGQTVGFVPLELDRYGEWVTLPGAYQVDRISKAAAWIESFKRVRQDAAEPGTYAIGRVNLVMIDRPGPHDHREGATCHTCTTYNRD